MVHDIIMMYVYTYMHIFMHDKLSHVINVIYYTGVKHLQCGIMTLQLLLMSTCVSGATINVMLLNNKAMYTCIWLMSWH